MCGVVSLEWAYSFMLGAKVCWGGRKGRRGYSQSPTRLSLLYGGKDLLAHGEIYFCSPQAPIATFMYIDLQL